MLSNQQIVFIDSQVTDLQILKNGVASGIEVIILDSHQDGIEQITEVLSQKPYSKVHIVSHGSPGCLYLGNTQLSLDTLNTYKSQLKTWFNPPACSTPLNKGGRGDLLLYGCNVAAGDAGEEFITKLHNITGAEIAASTTRIGNAAKGGNWELDYQIKSDQIPLAFTEQTINSYAGVFASVSQENTTSGTFGSSPTSLTRTFNVTEAGTLTSLTLGFNATHLYRGDIRATLTAPDATSVIVIASSGSDDDINYDVLLQTGGGALDDNNLDNTASPFYDRTVAPSNALSAFTGKSIQGTWTLTILDTFPGEDDGTFNRAQLNLEYTPAIPTIAGTVFSDYDNDGTQELANTASEVGYEGITVTATFSDGSTATDTTDANGDYSITNTNSLAARVEFTLPDGYVGSSLASADANTVGSVFFNDGTSQTANFGIFNPNQYITNTSPTLVIPCYVYSGATGAGSAAAIVTVLHSDSGDLSRSPNTETAIVTVNDVGAVNGLAYNKETEDLFAGAFQKRHSDVKNQNNGVIYRVDTNNSNAVNELIDLEDFFGANVAGAYSHDSANYDIDAVAFDAVGKVALGDVEISEDRQHIWTINLADRSLYKIEVGDGTKHTAGDGKERTQYEILGDDNTSPTNGGIPLNDLGADPNTNIRPFALAQKDGLIYVGMINSAESTQNQSDLHAYVYTFDPATETFSSNPVVDFALNYPRERKGVNVDDNEPPGLGAQAEWDPWVSDFNDFTFSVFGSSFNDFNDIPDQTQPWLTDIEFDRNGNLILGLRDRTADQVGNLLPDPDGTVPNNDDPNNSPGTGLDGYRVFSGGDILRATPSSTTSGTWDIENIATETDEFYDSEVFNGHQETAQGGLLQLPGYDHIVTTAMDPVQFNTGGLIKLSDTDGTQTTTGIELYDTSLAGNFAKANGLGDVEFFAELAPIEIGDRIWNDTDGDGIQDAGEAGISVVAISLYDSTGATVYGTTTTDSNGNYYFNDSNVNQNGATGLDPNTQYQIQISSSNFNAGQPLENLNLTVANQESNDLIDSDATNVSSIPTISVTTGDYGENDFSLDAGFTSQEFDYGDAPDTTGGNGAGDYTTTEANGGASHVITSGLSIGSTVDADDGTLNNAAATADDNNGTDDEDGITTFDTLATNTSTYSVEVDVTNTTGGDVTLIGWIDFDGNGVFDTDEEAIATVANNDTTATLTWNTIPGDITAGTTYSRFRISSDALTEANSTGAATDGEVEDYQLTIAEADYGDAPDTSGGNGAGDYTTTAANGGASHAIASGLSIGSIVDGDDGTLQNSTATADDNDGTDDEDGITSFDTLATNASTYSVEVDVTNTSGGDVTLIGWIDFDGNGVFDTDEEAIATVANNDTSATLTWSTIPGDITAGTTYSRFRISSDALTESDSTGAATDGEVEDYKIEIKNGITGNDYSETLTNSTPDVNDIFTGGAGQDTLTGNGGNDCFKFSVTSDGIDIITDFDAATSTTYNDRLDLSNVFNNELSALTITDNPFTDGYVKAITSGSNVMIQIDPTPLDNSDDFYAKNIALLEGVAVGNIDASDFIF
ncbi:DUF4347 domain-containing protein [Waterburya agarophytonicola K14]|uniref:DUF4347 domain-containing protein n=1 Tax=Waterburya agarophytonicola KI4 TaxID=2874699 RepID=A0A964BTJ5_9CYAN|nr:DUF4347 domain-containing protein [Waterburya agarophytonicola]MCC0179539.1 DUF4347 domain-containing protein [Waterburya agarophytonicola KI4]